ncbi:MAG: gas vesicle protein GvpK [Vulcanimicrobiota bacterium]
MHIDLKEGTVKQSVLGLVLAIVEVIRDVLRLQAERRIEMGSLSESEMERLGLALMELDNAIQEIRITCGCTEIVDSLRESLDTAVDDLLFQVFTEPLSTAIDNRKEEMEYVH